MPCSMSHFARSGWSEGPWPQMPTYLGGVGHVPHARGMCVVVMLTYFDYHVILSSSIIIYHHLSSSIIIYHHLSSSIIIYHHLSSSIIISSAHLAHRTYTKGDLERLILGSHQHLRILWILCHPPPIWTGTWVAPLALGLCRLQRLQATAGFRSSKYLATSPGVSEFLGETHETAQKQITTNILGDTGSQQKPATSQLRSFRSEMSSLGSDFTPSELDRYKSIRICKMCFPDFFSWWSPTGVPCQIQGGKIPKIPFT